MIGVSLSRALTFLLFSILFFPMVAGAQTGAQLHNPHDEDFDRWLRSWGRQPEPQLQPANSKIVPTTAVGWEGLNPETQKICRIFLFYQHASVYIVVGDEVEFPEGFQNLRSIKAADNRYVNWAFGVPEEGKGKHKKQEDDKDHFAKYHGSYGGDFMDVSIYDPGVHSGKMKIVFNAPPPGISSPFPDAELLDFMKNKRARCVASTGMNLAQFFGIPSSPTIQAKNETP